MREKGPSQIGLVLPAGGARAAYQVGVLSYIADHFPAFQPTIFSGISAGSINSCFLAQGDNFQFASEKMENLWGNLQFSQVLQTNFKTIMGMTLRWVYDLYVSRITRRLLVKSFLDATPLSTTLLQHIHFWKISQALRSGKVKGLSITTTNYHDGTTTVFYDCNDPVEPWIRQRRIAIHTTLRVRHVMASCSIPVLFQPIRIGNFLYGDGSLRFNYPFSPAIHLGATHIFAISIRCPCPADALGFRPDNVSLGFVAGTVLNSIFLDSLEQDYENILRLNEVSNSSSVRFIHPFIIQPSQDLGNLAKDYLKEVPFHLRQLLLSVTNAEEVGDLLSYLMFSPEYTRTLINLGKKDAAYQHENIARFVNSMNSHQLAPASI